MTPPSKLPVQTKFSDATGSPTFMAVYLSNEFFYNICKRRDNGTDYIVVEKRAYDFEKCIYKQEVVEGTVSFKIRAEREKYLFYYATEG